MGSIQFARVGSGREIAYRELSNVEAPAIVHFYTATAAMELLDDERMYARMLEILAAAGHLILFDKPGIGASDPFDDGVPAGGVGGLCDPLLGCQSLGAAGRDCRSGLMSSISATLAAAM